MHFVLYFSDASTDYALVNFIEDGCTAVVPLSRVSTTEADDECFVVWDNGKEYRAYFLLSGTIKLFK